MKLRSILTGFWLLIKPMNKLAKERYEVCKPCEKRTNFTLQCKACYCYTPAKVRVQWEYCPEGKWEN